MIDNYICNSKHVNNSLHLTFEPGVSSTITQTFSLILHLKCCTGVLLEAGACATDEWVGFGATAAAAVPCNLGI
jgi:hypothetical protein